MKSIHVFSLSLLLYGMAHAADMTHADDLAKYNVVWASPSADARGSMPIGNGDIGLNVWVEPSGDLCFFIGKTDAWDENMRLLKLNKVRIAFDPALNPAKNFRWELNLREGVIAISDTTTSVRVWVDANHPVIHVDARARDNKLIAARVRLEPWRKEKRSIPGCLGQPSGGEYHSTGFTSLPAVSYPDKVIAHTEHQIGWYHRNIVSPWLPSLKLQKLEAIAATQQDPLLNRACGGIVRGDDFVSVSDLEMKTAKPAKELSVRIHVLTRITDPPGQWLAAVEKQARAVERISVAKRRREHERWWNEFWNRSWILVEGDKNAETVTRGYVLQRWINACGGRGSCPIKFNGSIFVVNNKFDADYRAWGGGYWWQNTRLLYWSMLAAGDFDLMRPLFEMYEKALPARKLATRNYYGHAGAFYPETMSFWGNYLDQADLGYGTNRTGKADGLTDNQYIRRYWQGGLEMVALMLDYYDMTKDHDFRDKALAPFAAEIITFFDQHWKRGGDGRILLHPSQSLETWWDCTNPTPEIAGLRYVIPRLHSITGTTRWQKTLDDLPRVPLSDDGTRIFPAEKFADMKNVENPELYAVFPYRLYGVGKPALEVGRATFAARRYRQNGGWQQNAIQAALLGLADVAGQSVGEIASNHAGEFRFPAMWGPNYDWTPDQDHGSVMVAALQRMLVQYEGDRIIALPAWPKGWNVSFKLHAPGNTTVEGVYRTGKLEQLKVVPESRRKDVEVTQ